MKTLVRAGAATSAFVTAVAMAAGVPDVSVAAASSATSPTGTATYGRSVREALRQPASEPVRLQPSDPRIRTVVYSPDAVVFIPVRRGVVTQIVLTEDDAITLQPAMGKGADCARETDTWCVIASGRDIFIKPKTGATTNNMVLVASRRRYVFDFKVISEGPASQAVMRVSLVVPPPAAPLPVVMQAAAAVDRGPPRGRLGSFGPLRPVPGLHREGMSALQELRRSCRCLSCLLLVVRLVRCDRRRHVGCVFDRSATTFVSFE